MSQTDITVYGANWCPDCRRSKLFLGEHRIPYTWLDIEEDSEARRFVTEKNGGKRIIPTIVFQDGSFLVEPTNAQLAAKLGLKTLASRTHYDLIVIGGGPAGLTAALYTAREAIDTLVIERSSFGGQTSGTEKLENMPGFPEGVEGIEFSNRLKRQAERFGVELLEARQVESIERHGNLRCVRMEDGRDYSARALLIATGSHYRRLNVAGEAEFLGAGVHFCATCDGPFYKGKRIAVIGGGNSAAEESLLLTKFAQHLTLLVRGEELTATRLIQEKVQGDPKIDIRRNTQVREFIGQGGKLNRIKYLNTVTGDEEELAVEGAFIFIGMMPNTGFLAQSGVLLDQWGFIVTGQNLPETQGYEKRVPYMFETSVPGVFAAGDVRDASTKQAVSAAGEGAAAALAVRDYLKQV